MAPERVVSELGDDVRGAILGSAGGRFFVCAIGGTLPAALAADWLTSTWDQNAALYSCAPAAAVVEEVSGEWLKGLLGLPAPCTWRTGATRREAGRLSVHLPCPGSRSKLWHARF
jgi:glutamate/tyrosine decarboxylase-like PLP-dependent enzyme